MGSWQPGSTNDVGSNGVPLKLAKNSWRGCLAGLGEQGEDCGVLGRVDIGPCFSPNSKTSNSAVLRIMVGHASS
jgi:hypothetical protein